MSFLDTLIGGGKVAAIGVMIVFIALILLILGIELMHLIFSKSEGKAAKKKVAKPAKKAASDSDAEEVAVAIAAASVAAAMADEDELAVVISAAIAAYLENDPSADPSRLVVRHVQRVGRNTPVWSNQIR